MTGQWRDEGLGRDAGISLIKLILAAAARISLIMLNRPPCDRARLCPPCNGHLLPFNDLTRLQADIPITFNVTNPHAGQQLAHIHHKVEQALMNKFGGRAKETRTSEA